MKVKKNILGLAVAISVASVSMPAISDEIPKPDAFDNVNSTAPTITSGGSLYSKSE